MTRAPEQLALRLAQALLVGLLVLLGFLALVVPYHATDALVYGQFSQLIGREGGFLFDQVGYPNYARPLFYAPQGWLWWAFGAHEWIGRLLSLAFFVLLLWSVMRVARDRALPAAAPWLAGVLLVATPDVVAQAIAGQTDVPVAALVAAAAALLLRSRPSGRIAVLVALAAAAAVLAKATAIPALVGLGLACLIGDRAGLPRRLRWGVLPLAVGTGVGLLYGLLMARHFDVALNEFLGGATGTPAEAAPPAPAGGAPAAGGGEAAGPTFVAPPAEGVVDRVRNAVDDFVSSDRPSVLLRVEWLGPYVRLLALFALLYAVGRVVRVPHRVAALGALAVAFLVYWLTGSPLDTGAGAVLGSILLLVPLTAVAWCPEELRATRVLLARLLAFGLPPLLAWGLFGILADTRTVSPAWPALFVLMGAILAMGVAGLRLRSAWLAAAAVALVVGLGVLDLRNVDGLGARPDGSISSLRALKELTPSTWTDPDAARIAADPQLGGEVAGIRAALPPGGRVMTNDGRLGFYWIERVTVQQPPADCSQLRDHDVLAVLLNVAAPFDADGFECLEPVREEPGSYAVYRVR